MSYAPSPLPEQTRNRLLRRVDWRFLLPNPCPRVAICLTNGLLAKALPLICSQMSESPAPDGVCDLAVAVNPNTATLQHAWRALCLGGVLYSEWYYPWVGSLGGVNQRLTNCGFESINSYWAWPWPTHGNPHFWLPMEAPNALRYFHLHRPSSNSPGERIARELQRWLWQMSVRARLTVPLCVVAYKASSTPLSGAAKPNEWLAQWPIETQPGHPPRIDQLLLTGGLRSINKVVSLVFVDREPEPRLILKWPRVDESIPALQNEAVTLGAVHQLRPGGLPGVPRVLFQGKGSAIPVLGETALAGTPLWKVLHRDNYPVFAQKATDWLIDLARGKQPRERSNWWGRLIEPRLAAFATCFGTIVGDQQLGRLRATLGTLGDLPLVCEQRDFSPWNVLIDARGELVVLDWESAELQGLPAIDLIYFLTYLALFVEGVAIHGIIDLRQVCCVYRATLDPRAFVGSVVDVCLKRYLGCLGVLPNQLPALRILTWLIHSHSEYGRLVADGETTPDSDRLRRSFCLSLLKEELSHVHHQTI